MWQIRRQIRRGASAALLSYLTLCSAAGLAQSTFKIVWVAIGEAASGDGNAPSRAGRQLFMAPDLVALSLKNIKVVKVDVNPAIVQLHIGQRFCLTSLNIQALSPERTALPDAPLSVTVRQDHKTALVLERARADICVSPSEPGEYPIRFASVLPAPDGTVRGAQIFVRVGAADVPPAAANGS